MKKLLLLVLLCFSLSKGYSAFLVNIPQTLKQPDGTVLHCFASGDEFYNWLHDSLGYTIVQNAQRYYVYALPATEGQIAPSNHIVGIADPAALGLPVRVNISNEIIMARRAEFEASIPPKSPQRKAGTNTGTLNNIVIFVRFSDEAGHTKTFSYMNTMFNDSSSLSANSLYNFFKQASYGQLFIPSHFFPAPNGNVIVSYKDTYPRSYYKPYHATSNPNGFTSDRTSREHALLERVVKYAEQFIPSTLNIDYDNDGYVDNVCFMVSGDPIQGGGILWPHRWYLYTRDVKIHGKRVYDYNLNLENINGNSTCAGVITHEMMHTLGAPDLYRYDYDLLVKPVGEWDLMASTTYSRPQGLGAHMKCRYGKWIPDLPEITAPGTYTLYPVNDSTMVFDANKSIGYRINIPGSPDESIVLEYRKTNASFFEASLPGTGILIYRVNKRMKGNADATGESPDYDEVYIFRPGGTKTVNGNINTAHFSANVGRTVFDAGTNPFPFLCNGDTIKEFSISNVTIAGDSIQFTYNPRWLALGVNKEQVDFGYQSGNMDAITITSNTPWTMSGVDTSWLNVSVLQGDSGTTTVQLSTRSQNNLRVPKTGTLIIQYGEKEKHVAVSQGMQPIVSCQDVNNECHGDTLLEYNFQQHGVTAVSEYFAATDEGQVIDSVSFYFGDIALNDLMDNVVKLEIYTSNASNRPGTTVLTQNILARDLTPNAWNTIPLQKPVITSKGLTVGYSFDATPASKIAIFKNAQTRTGTYYGTMLVRQGSWKKPFEADFPDIANYSLAMKLFVCPPSPATDTLLVSATNFQMSYDSNVQISFDITSNASWEVVNLPDGFSINQAQGSGNKTIIITTTSKHREVKKIHYFWVRSGSILHDMTIERATYPLILNKKEVEFNYQGTDSAEVYITASGTSWEAQTDCTWLRLSRTSGNAGLQKLVIYPTGENNSPAAFEGCVDVVSPTLNEQICIIVRQNSSVGVPQIQPASAFSLYPNPTTSQLFVHNGNKPIQTIVIYNIIGKEILKITNINSSQTELNTANLPAGLYVIKVISAEGVQVRRFVRN